MKTNQQLLTILEEHIHALQYPEVAQHLFEPIQYTLSLGGKRIRPLLTLMATQLFEGKTEDSLWAAIGIETFHNFTLLHDDLMDHASLRRNQPTVHIKWDANAAILSGDAMQIMAYQMICKSPLKTLPAVLDLFSQTALEICQGQQMDMEFESRSDVTKEEYLDMIRLKTAVLLGCALKTGALISGANPTEAQHLYQFGEYIGLAFQLQDDLLDAYADVAKFGKKIGGDILNNKKTYLWLTALERANTEELEKANLWINKENPAEEEKIKFFLSLYEKTEVKSACQTLMNEYYDLALTCLAQVGKSDEATLPLKTLAQKLMCREL